MTSWLQPPAWMSFWDRYLAPGDLRSRAQQPQQPEAPDEKPPTPAPAPRIDAAHRMRRQGALLYGGMAFTAISLIVTRRSLARKYAVTYPRMFTPSNAEPAKVEGSLEAVEALGLATLNVFSMGIMGVGAIATFFDVADIEDLRDGIRKSVGYDVYGGTSDADKEIEAWLADILARKDMREGGGFREGVMEKLGELEKREREANERDMAKKGAGTGR